MGEIPEGLNEREYAMYALENGIGRPATKSNLELIASCIRSISRTKGMSLPRAMQYLIRAVKLANEQYVPVDYAFFSDAVYLKMRPKTQMPSYKPTDREAFEAHKRTPEYQADLKVYQARMSQLLGLKAMSEAKK